ncbi:MAG: hypothetical protein EA398_16610, partial [Deltaproteobacteria bacterium]
AAEEPLPAWLQALAARAAVRERLAKAFPDEGNRALFLRALAVVAPRRTVSMAALAAHLGVPPRRLPGLVATGQEVVNVDGYAVLQVKRPSMDVTLNEALLRQQFGVTDDG